MENPLLYFWNIRKIDTEIAKKRSFRCHIPARSRKMTPEMYTDIDFVVIFPPEAGK